MKYIINGEEVEYINVDTSNNQISITYYEKFNIVTTPTHIIEKRLRDKNINATICKDLYRGYIGIFLEYIEDYVGIIHILEIPINAFSIDHENNFLLIRINEIPKYHNKTRYEIMKMAED